MWINNELRNPDSPGRYVVKTITTTMKNKRKFEALYIGVMVNGMYLIKE